MISFNQIKNHLRRNVRVYLSMRDFALYAYYFKNFKKVLKSSVWKFFTLLVPRSSNFYLCNFWIKNILELGKKGLIQKTNLPIISQSYKNWMKLKKIRGRIKNNKINSKLISYYLNKIVYEKYFYVSGLISKIALHVYKPIKNSEILQIELKMFKKNLSRWK